MRRIRTCPLIAGRASLATAAPPVAGMLAVVAVALSALISPPAAPPGTGLGGPATRPALGASPAAFQREVLPPRDRNSGELTADRPDPTPTGVHGLVWFTLAAGLRHRRAGRAAASQSRRRTLHRTGGDPRAPPATPFAS